VPAREPNVESVLLQYAKQLATACATPFGLHTSPP
jgi:hypothetical protein